VRRATAEIRHRRAIERNKASKLCLYPELAENTSTVLLFY
jgi:hypothetical protein